MTNCKCLQEAAKSSQVCNSGIIVLRKFILLLISVGHLIVVQQTIWQHIWS